MRFEELEAEALKLPEAERALLAERLLASLGVGGSEVEDPILGLGSAPVSLDSRDGSKDHDRHLYGPVDRVPGSAKGNLRGAGGLRCAGRGLPRIHVAFAFSAALRALLANYDG